MNKITITEEHEVEFIVCVECGMKYRIEAVVEKEDHNVLWPLERVGYCPFCGESWKPCDYPEGYICKHGHCEPACPYCHPEPSWDATYGSREEIK